MRIEGWEGLLSEHIAAAYREQFSWGRHDCALWCADWIRKATGRDILAEWKGKYKTEKGAALLMRKRGFQGVAAIASGHMETVQVALARRGDIVLHPTQGCLGICNGRHSFFITEDSVTTADTLACLRAWKV